MSKKIVNVGIIGLGTVGGGVVKTLLSKKSILSEKSGADINLTKVFDLDKSKIRQLHIPKRLIAKSAQDVVDDMNIDILVELIGGINPASEIIIGALCNGKHVVTANKAYIAEYGQSLFQIASQLGCSIGFEASVGGAMPIIKMLNESFAGNTINAIYGIVNGTCNFVLTKMDEDKINQKQAIIEAQKLGLAEANPTLDIDGHDSCHKLCVLSMLAYGKYIRPEDVYVEGIRNIDLMDIVYAHNWGYDIKLLAIGKRKGDLLELRVHPTLIPAENLLSSVRGEDNAVFIKGDMIGDSMIYGKGAGRYPAASSVISDIIDIARNIALSGNSNPFKLVTSGNEKLKVAKIGGLVTKYYLRFSVIDRPGVLSSISSILAKNKISIATVSQVGRKEAKVVPVVMLTHEAKESSMQKALKVINKLGFVKNKTVCIRIEK